MTDRGLRTFAPFAQQTHDPHHALLGRLAGQQRVEQRHFLSLGKANGGRSAQLLGRGDVQSVILAPKSTLT